MCYSGSPCGHSYVAGTSLVCQTCCVQQHRTFFDALQQNQENNTSTACSANQGKDSCDM
jgi:hypothetical protein